MRFRTKYWYGLMGFNIAFTLLYTMGHIVYGVLVGLGTSIFSWYMAEKYSKEDEGNL